jgi:hypothetical protein
MVTAALVAQSAEALRGLNYDKQNWQSIFSGNGNSNFAGWDEMDGTSME